LILDGGVRRPNQRWKWPGWLLLPKHRMERLTRQLLHNDQPVWHADAEMGRAFAAIAAALATAPVDSTRLKILINEVILCLADLLDRRRPTLDASLSSSEHTVRLFLQELEHRVDEPWTLELMAAQCGLRRSAFSKLCRQLTNRTPIDYLTECRLRCSRRLMSEDPALSITEIAYASGFQSSQYFATVFSRHLGRSPRAWRRRAWSGSTSKIRRSTSTESSPSRNG
jgi:AraC-like DNA-binding protein